MIIYRPSKKIASPLIAYLAAFGYIIGLTLILFALLHRSNETLVFSSVLFLIDVIALFICSRHYAWVLKTTLCDKGNLLIFSVFDIVDALGHSDTRIKILKVTEIISKNNKLYLKGDFKVKEPLKHEYDKNKIVIKDYSPEMVDVIKEFSKR